KCSPKAKNIQSANKFKFHYGCKALQLSNLCFRDDLLVVCNGDVESVGVIQKTMEQFSSISGQFPNMGKSTIFFGSVPLDVQHEILQVMPFQVGHLPMKYLGVPLIAKKLGVNDCKSLSVPTKACLSVMVGYQGKIGYTRQISKWNCYTNFECPLCKKERDSHDHLFFKCEFAKLIWRKLREKIESISKQDDLKTIVSHLSHTHAK
nr:RNA-directed DNA polymerase, eukaryota, reverse transcriptase zinc-binding domain protein [Tanacetum cinerariifolium]